MLNRNNRFYRLPLAAACIAALTLTGSAPAQPARGHQTKLPGERFTPAQRQALAGYGSDVLVEFGNQEVPVSLTGPLAIRVRPDDPAAEAQAALDRNAAAFRIGPHDRFVYDSVEADKAGGQHVHMKQTYDGIPVEGGELVVHLSRSEVRGISGRFIADLNLSTDVAAGSADRAAASALAFAAGEGTPNPRVAGLRGPVVIADRESAGHLAIPVELSQNDGDGAGRDLVYADAANGQILSTQTLAPLAISGGCPTGQICPSTQLLKNPNFEFGRDGSWGESSTIGAKVVDMNGTLCYSGAWCAWLDGWGSADTDRLYQMVTIPSNVTSATLSFYLKIKTDEGLQWPYDTLAVQLRSPVLNPAGYYPGAVLAQLATYSNVSAWSLPFSGGNYVRQSFDVTGYRGKTLFVYFEGKEDSSKLTSFFLDSVLLTVQ